jgi:cell wall-associated NlpC family hydrolase
VGGPPWGRAATDAITCQRAYADVPAFRAALRQGFAGTICLLGSAARPAATTAVRFALGAIGTPYVWAGDGPADGGYDCSGLTSASYASAGVRLPRTAQSQFNAGPRLSPGRRILPGDLVFFGRGTDRVTHVGIAVSATEMINAPQPGERVRIGAIQRRDFVGATRPAPLAFP